MNKTIPIRSPVITPSLCSHNPKQTTDPSIIPLPYQTGNEKGSGRANWTKEEDQKLRDYAVKMKKEGPKWFDIGKQLGRMGIACFDRWRIIAWKKEGLDKGGVEEGDVHELYIYGMYTSCYPTLSS